MKENSIEDRIEEKYLNRETGTLELTIEEAIFILETDESFHYVEDLLQEAYKVILSDYKRVLKENEKLTYARNWYFENTVNKICNPEMLNKILKEDYIPVQKIKDLMGEKEWAIKSYDCSEADYNQSQAVGAWFACQRLLEERKK